MGDDSLLWSKQLLRMPSWDTTWLSEFLPPFYHSFANVPSHFSVTFQWIRLFSHSGWNSSLKIQWRTLLIFVNPSFSPKKFQRCCLEVMNPFVEFCSKCAQIRPKKRDSYFMFSLYLLISWKRLYWQKLVCCLKLKNLSTRWKKIRAVFHDFRKKSINTILRKLDKRVSNPY